ncbi:MAG: hypothetical protein EBZ47_08950 [Chlamydiae bacterium]|nr:hypothetical protein [Chlamydiota bacterium]
MIVLGRAKKRMLYNRRFKTAVVGFGKKGVRNYQYYVLFLCFNTHYHHYFPFILLSLSMIFFSCH